MWKNVFYLNIKEQMCCEWYFVKIDHLNYVFVMWLQNIFIESCIIYYKYVILRTSKY